ncbi:hypothetical protein Dsin_001499 [Dipteronia sinensis]|uniref:Reverse transcriptase zinc-binding domain-containing protein n=1 Tax=Dipteronia sinensis TaxID=43782 RepID=A0AAE0B441_9ROSI|nr:hypothetical protein Dsin_001499 [Dipteronia sinensis]
MPLKIKIFIWRACNDWIPTLANLNKRGIEVNRICPVCKQAYESTVHALWTCCKTKAYSDVFSWSSNYAVACETPRPVSNRRGKAVKRSELRWKAPDIGYYKVNCSAEAGLGGKRIGIGIVIRNCAGDVMASCAQFGGNRRFEKAQTMRWILRPSQRPSQRLARIGVDCMDDKFWMEEVPASIRDLVEADMLS